MSRRRTPRGDQPADDASAQAYDAMTNEAIGFSGFGGVRLAAVADAAPDASAQLAALGVEDAEQLVAMAAVPGILEELESVLGQEVRTILAQAARSLPTDRAALVSAPAPRDLGLGVLRPTEEMLAAAAASALDVPPMMARAVALPAAINLRPFMPPIRNQGSRGTCVAFTLTALNEYVLRRRGVVRDLAEQHLYQEIKLIDGDPNACGTWQVRAVNALRTRGQCREYIWPYNANSPCNSHGTRPSQARPDGLQYRLNTIQVPARSVAAYKEHLSRQRPVTLSIPVYDSWHQSAEVRRSGRITMRIGNEQSDSGHAVCLVGYQDSPASPGGGFFIVRNSWGTTWAYQSPYGAGYGTIPYQYITDDAWEAFTAVVSGIAEDEDVAEDEQPDGADGQTTVTINVGRNVKITINTK